MIAGEMSPGATRISCALLFPVHSFRFALGGRSLKLLPDPDHSVGEERWLTFGMSRMGRILAIIYTEGRDTIRLISARLATKHERGINEES